MRVTASVLDRLLSVEKSDTFGMDSPDIFNKSLRRDLEYVLNTVRAVRSDIEERPQLRGTLLDFGLPEFFAIDTADPEAQTRVAIAIERAIRVFEPRLANVSVVPVLDIGADRLKGTANPLQLSFRVRADVRYLPARQRVEFRALLENGACRLQSSETSGNA